MLFFMVDAFWVFALLSVYYSIHATTTTTTYIQFSAHFFIFSKIYHVFNGKLIFKMKFFFTSVFNFSLDSCCQFSFSFAALFTPPKAKISIKPCRKSKKRKHIVVCCTKNTYTHLVWISSKWRNICEKNAVFLGFLIEIFMATVFFPTKILCLSKYKRKLFDELLKFLLNVCVFVLINVSCPLNCRAVYSKCFSFYNRFILLFLSLSLCLSFSIHVHHNFSFLIYSSWYYAVTRS